MVNFPNTLDDNTSLYLAVNNRRTRLTSPIDDTMLTIPVVTTSGFPTNGFITILSDVNDITKAEAIRYTSIDATNFYASVRGSSNTTARPHKQGDNVDLTIVEEHHNALKDAVVALENYIGPVGGEHFLRVDSMGNALVSGTFSVQQDTTVTGSLDVHGDLSVSGTAFFGQTVVATGTQSEVLFASNDVQQTTTSTSYVDSGCTSGPLVVGVDYLVIYTCSFSSNSTSDDADVQVLFGSTKIARGTASFGKWGGEPPFIAHYTGGQLCGFYKVTGDGSSVVKIQYKITSAGSTASIGAQTVVCLPLSDRFTEGTDYFFSGTNSDTATVTNVSTLSFTDVLNTNFTLPAAGDYLVMMSVESLIPDVNTSTGGSARLLVASSQIGPQYLVSPGRGSGGDSNNGMASANIVNIASPGSTTFQVQGISRLNAQADFRRPRIFAIQRSSVKQIVHSTNSTGVTTTNSAYTDFPALTSTIVPGTTDAPIITMVTSNMYTTASGTFALAEILNLTDNLEYRLESGLRNTFAGGTGSATLEILPSLFMIHQEQRSDITQYKVRFKSNGSSTVALGRNISNTGGELSEIILWEYATSQAVTTPFDRTVIDDDKITTFRVTADQINARQLLTVSGSPVLLNVPDPLSLNTLAVSGSLTVSGSTVVTKVPVQPAIVSGSSDLTVTSGSNQTVIRDNNRAIIGSGRVNVASGTNTITIDVPSSSAIVSGYPDLTVVSGTNRIFISDNNRAIIAGSSNVTITSGTNTITIDAVISGSSGTGSNNAIVGDSFIGVISGTNTINLVADAIIAGTPDLTVTSGTFSVVIRDNNRAVIAGTPDLTITSGTNTIVVRDNNRALIGSGQVTIASGTNTIRIDVPATTAIIAGNNIAVTSGTNTNTIATTSVVNFTTVTGTTVTGTTAAFAGSVSGQTVSADTNMTISGTPVMHQGLNALTVSGANLTRGTINLVGSRGTNVSISGQTITFDSSSTSTGSGGVTTLNNLFGDLTISGAGTVTVTPQNPLIVVSGSATVSYIHNQSSPSSTWTISHGLNSTDLVCQIYDQTNEKIEADTEKAISTSTYQITFNTSLQGKAVLFKA